MARGKSKFKAFGIPGHVHSITAPEWDFIYRVSSVRDANWFVGDGVDLPDGRRFRYCLSSDVCDTYKANAFTNEIGTGATHVGVDWSVLAEAAAIGDTSVLVTAPASRAIAEDALRGGLMVLSITTGANTTVQQRVITGNTAAAASGTLRVYLDAPLVATLTTSSYIYCMPSLYSAVENTGSSLEGSAEKGKYSFCGYAAAPVNAASLYHWEQVKGQISVSKYGSGVGETQYMREVVFRYDGNIIHRASSGITGLEAQHAGYIMDKNAAANGATVIMLQLE